MFVRASKGNKFKKKKIFFIPSKLDIRISDLGFVSSLLTYLLVSNFRSHTIQRFKNFNKGRSRWKEKLWKEEIEREVILNKKGSHNMFCNGERIYIYIYIKGRKLLMLKDIRKKEQIGFSLFFSISKSILCFYSQVC